jgi:hypothetical protein
MPEAFRIINIYEQAILSGAHNLKSAFLSGGDCLRIVPFVFGITFVHSVSSLKNVNGAMVLWFQ